MINDNGTCIHNGELYTFNTKYNLIGNVVICSFKLIVRTYKLLNKFLMIYYNSNTVKRMVSKQVIGF